MITDNFSITKTININVNNLKKIITNLYYKDIVLFVWICPGDGILINIENKIVSYIASKETLRTKIENNETMAFVQDCVIQAVRYAKDECKKLINNYDFCRFHDSLGLDTEKTNNRLLYFAVADFYGDECQKFIDVDADKDLVVTHFMRLFDSEELKGAEANLFTHGTREDYVRIFTRLFETLSGQVIHPVIVDAA